ncbi:hypothetical protein GQ43DRAFT_455150 [Delitschia confertaspora ATCC 74209]|uniref:Haloacid dehalogenase-like hydrolase n=1 Tax=Delitschia confertaspora ATCC 74209 TaxID=1513339 RepID=A0A9P4MWP1_9PLEO|nr:hypothetical protein GQ43DRAFT_455150 [Delitschia confertaspora ATCC 74209]
MRVSQATQQKKNLLLAFDAFGTLFTPKIPIEVQYGEVAHRYGIGGFTDESLKASFHAAFKNESKWNPNYGKLTGLDAQQWWKNVISNSFKPFLKEKQEMPQQLFSELLTRFSTKDGYKVYEDVTPFFEMLRRAKANTNHGEPWKWQKTVVGVITNSDNRALGVLRSLGLTVGPWTAESSVQRKLNDRANFDISFVVLSYDVGFEKPHPFMFTAAKRLLLEISADYGQEASTPSLDDYEMLYVGDDVNKDYFGAKAAGWNSLYLDRHGQYTGYLPDSTSIATVDVEEEHGEGERIEAIRDLRALCGWSPKASTVR